MLPPLCFSVSIMYFSEALSCGPLEHILMQSFEEKKRSIWLDILWKKMLVYFNSTP